jgi:hypothetical protein
VTTNVSAVVNIPYTEEELKKLCTFIELLVSIDQRIRKGGKHLTEYGKND